MEDLALLVSGILLGLFLAGAGAVVLAILARKGKISKYWPLASSIALIILALIAWQGSERLALVPFCWATLTAAITLWPGSKK